MAQRAASMIGFKGDKKLGLQYLRDCYQSSCVRSHFAGIILALNHLVISPSIDRKHNELLFKEAQGIIDNCLNTFPDGSLFQIIAGVCNIESGKSDVAIEYLDIAIKNASHISEVPPIMYRVLSNCYVMQYNWETAAEVMEKLLSVSNQKKSMNPWTNSWHSLKLGSAYIMLDLHDKAMEAFKEAADSRENDRWSKHIIKLANKYIRTKGYFSMFECMTLTGHFDKLLNSTEVEKKGTNVEDDRQCCKSS